MVNFKCLEFSIGFLWILSARYGYKFDVRVAIASKIIEEDRPRTISSLL